MSVICAYPGKGGNVSGLTQEEKSTQTAWPRDRGRLVALRHLMYLARMSHIHVYIDDEACAEVMRRYQLATKREAINFALRTLAAEPLRVDEAKRLRGSGWEGDLDELRTDRLA